MRTNTLKALSVLLGLVPAVAAWTGLKEIMTLQPESRLWIEGTSTVRSFTCKATTLDVKVESNGPAAVASLMAGDKAVRGATVTVPAARLECGNGTMNEHMLKALKAKDNPTISFRLASYDMQKADDALKGTVTGTLLLGGVEKTITMSGTAKEAPTGTLRVAGTYEINMKEYGLKPPTLMLGTMKVGEKVKVGFDLLLKD